MSKKPSNKKEERLELEGVIVVAPKGFGDSTVVVKTQKSRKITVCDKDGIQEFDNTH